MSRRRSADHARVRRIIDATKPLEERKHHTPPLPSPLAVVSQLPAPAIPELQTPTSSATPPPPTPGSGGSSGGSGSGSGGGNNSGGQVGPSGNNGGGSSSTAGDSGSPSASDSGASNPGGGGGSIINPTSTPAPGAPTSATDASQVTGDATSNSRPGVVNAGSGSSTTSFFQASVTSILPNGVPVATSTHGRSSVGAGTGNSDGGNSGTNSESTSALSHGHGLSSGGIAGIVITLLIVGLAALVVMMRRRAIARRIERRQQWVTVGRGIASTGFHNDNGSSRIGSIGSGKMGTAAGTRSARSSFATTFDQSQTPRNMNFDALLPPVPPMAEIRGEGPFILGLDLNSSHMTNTGVKRNSAGSKNSTASDPNAQYLYLPSISQGNGAISSPMSVRPFSPSESYSFPKPPSDADRKSADRVSVFSQLYSNGPSGQVDNVRMSDATEHPSVEEVDPFADPIGPSAITHPVFADIEVIRRPFMPTLQDELMVAAGDRVRILQMFDDGWTLVQKVPPAIDKKGKARAVDEFDQGLIPIDCLRYADSDLPEFIPQKRVSSYADNLDANPARAL